MALLGKLLLDKFQFWKERRVMQFLRAQARELEE